MKDVMKAEELAEYLGTTVGTLAHWRYLGRGPRFVRSGRFIRYRAEDVRAWMEEQTRQGGVCDDAA